MTVQFSYKSYASGMGQDFNLNKENPFVNDFNRKGRDRGGKTTTTPIYP